MPVGRTISLACPYHGNFKNVDACPKCMEQRYGTTAPEVSVSDDWVNGTWEDLGPEPVKITGGREQLIHECKKRGVMARALLKPKSRGKGYEMKETRW